MLLTLVLTGRLDPDTFCDFITHRAEILDVDAAVLVAGPTRIVVRVQGQRDLVGAFEIACELAPRDSVVQSIHSIS